MECRKFEITLVSADNLPYVRSLGHMKVYAKVKLINGKSKSTKKSTVNREGGTNPTWNFPVEYTIRESNVHHPRVKISVKLFCKRTLGDRFIGKVKISLKSLFDMGLKAEKIMRYPVAGTPNGTLNIWYRFGEKIWKEEEEGDEEEGEEEEEEEEEEKEEEEEEEE